MAACLSKSEKAIKANFIRKRIWKDLEIKFHILVLKWNAYT